MKDDNNKTIKSKGNQPIVDTDLLLYMTMGNCSKALPMDYSLSNVCEVEDEFERPIVGTMILCYDLVKNFTLAEKRLIILNEILHIMLGEDLQGTSYRDEHGNIRINTIKTVDRKWKMKDGSHQSHTSVISTLPSVVDFAKRHFNCPTVEGIELVNILFPLDFTTYCIEDFLL